MPGPIDALTPGSTSLQDVAKLLTRKGEAIHKPPMKPAAARLSTRPYEPLDVVVCLR